MIDKPWKKWVAAATVTVMLAMPAAPALAAKEAASAKGTATSSVYIRSAAGGGEVLGSVPKGVTVDVLGISGLWVKVVYKGVTGYVFNEYITVDEAAKDAEIKVTPESFTGKVKATGNLNVRKGPGTGYSKLGSVASGAKVKVTGVSGEWYAIEYNGKTGYVSKEYIAKADAESNKDESKDETTKTESFKGVVKVSGSLNVRKGAGTQYAKLGTLKNGKEVTVTGSKGDWYAIDYNGTTGYVSRDYITKKQDDTTQKDETGDKDDTVTDTSFTGKIKVSGSLNVRKGAGTSYAKLGTLKNGAQVKVTGSKGNWYAIDYNGKTGYVSGDYVVKAEESDDKTDDTAFESFDGKVKISSGSLRMRKGAGTSHEVVAKLKNGAKVKVTGESGSWYKIDYDGKAGYVSKSYIVKVTEDKPADTDDEDAKTTKGYITASALNVRKGAGSNYSVLGKLYKGTEVEIISTADGWCKIKYGTGTGYVSASYVSEEEKDTEDTDISTGGSLLSRNFDMETTLSSGDTGSKVEDLQTVLKHKGFYSGKIDGIFDSDVKSAVKAFQKSAGLESDGIAGEYTLCSLYSMIYPVAKADLKLKALDNGSDIPIIKPSWSEANSLLPRRAEFTVVDVKTGYTYKCIRVGGSLHADVEPATATDTNIMYHSFNGKWSWARRPVWVVYNGVRMAASINCQPHGYETVAGNDMMGQVCIHFMNSRTHGGNVVDSAHQSCINEAYKAGQ